MDLARWRTGRSSSFCNLWSVRAKESSKVYGIRRASTAMFIVSAVDRSGGDRGKPFMCMQALMNRIGGFP